MTRLKILSAGLLCLFLYSCSNDEPKIPDNAININVMKEGYGETTIGNSDVYINMADNFVSQQCAITDIGTKGTLNRNPVTDQLSQTVAVEPGHFYQFFIFDDFETVAGERAFPLNKAFYNVYVDSWIYQAEEITGAKITYLESYPQRDHLPEWDETLEVILKSSNNNEVGSYSFDKNVVIDPDYTVLFAEDYFDQHVEITIKDNTISFFNPAWTPGAYCKLQIRVRQGSVYSQVVMFVNSSITR